MITKHFLKVLALGALALTLDASPLHDAAEKGDAKTIKLLVSKGENINEKNIKYKQTALQIATYNEDSSIVKLLISMGAKVDLKMKNGRTALHIASFYGDGKSVSYLLRANANINVIFLNMCFFKFKIMNFPKIKKPPKNKRF